MQNEIAKREMRGPVPDIKAFGANVRQCDPDRGRDVLTAYGYTHSSAMYRQYESIFRKKSVTYKDKCTFVANFILSTFQVLKLSNTEVYYVGNEDDPYYRRQRSREAIVSTISLWYQIFFGIDVDIDKASKAVLNGILPYDHYSVIDRQYIQIVDGLYWSKKDADIIIKDDLPNNTRVFAKMFDTDDEDDNIFKIPEFDNSDTNLMLETYEKLKDTPYEGWGDEYHFQCFKDWSVNRSQVEFGMFTVLALPYMRRLPRGSIFNSGEGHNGKSVLNGLAISLLGKNNASFVNGSKLGSWDYLTDLQTTWFNCPTETDLDFLKTNTDAFKTISAHETFSMRKKMGDASIPIVGNFPMVFNVNDVPDFGADASAILSRMFINDFDFDFEAAGRAIPDYARKTFLSDKKTIPTLVGMTLAFAHYYSNESHLWAPTMPMLRSREILKETAVPKVRYFEWLTKFFSSFTGITFPKQDFINFGRMEGETYDGGLVKLKDIHFKRFTKRSNSNGTYYKIDCEDDYGVRKLEMHENFRVRKYMGSMNWQEFMESGKSIVHMMMDDYYMYEEQYKEELKIAGVKKSRRDIEAHVMQKIFEDIDREGGGNLWI